MHRTRWRLGSLTAVLLACALTPAAGRADLVFKLDTVTNGATPAKADPTLDYFAKATFHTNSPGDVTLTLALNGPSGQFNVHWLFNVLAGVDVEALTFTYQAPPTSTGPTYTGLTLSNTQSLAGTNSVKAGLFNIDFEFQTSNSGAPGRFNGTEVSVFKITGGSITAESFDAASADGGTNTGAGGWLSAARFQGIPISQSGSVGAKGPGTEAVAPAPAGLLLGFAGAGSFGGFAGLSWLRRRLGRK